MAGEYVQIGNKKYIRVRDKLVEIDRFDDNGKPVIKATSTEVRHPDGKVDVTVHVSCLQVMSEVESKIASETNK